eukprot:s1330_g12.t1
MAQVVGAAVHFYRKDGMSSWAAESLSVVPMEDRHEASPQPPRNDTSDSGFADLLRDLSLTPPPLLESTDKSDPPSPPGHPDPASQELRHVSRQRSGDDPDATERRQSRRISLGDNGLPFELTNNEFVTAMRHYYSSNNLGGSWALNAEDIKNLQDHSQYVDWSQEKNLQKLKDVRKVVRSIFWGFEDIANVDDAEVPVLVISEDLRSRIKRLARQIVEGKAFTLYFIFLTLYALFGPDLLLMSGHSGMDQDNLTLSVINILVFLCFAFEEMLMCWVLPGYFLSLRFVMDTCATLSILGDTAIVAEIINTDAAVAMRTTRAMRGAGRSTRLISILRSLRVWQILKLLPRLQRLTESGTKELAMLMWHKRLQNVAGFIDDEGIGELSDEQMDFFTSALRLEFPKPQDEDKMKCLTWFLEKLSESTHATALRSWGQNLIPWWRSAKVEEADFSRYSLEIRSCWDMDMGQRAFRRCLDDITTMKASCTVLYQSMLGLILKICIIVLALLLMLQFVSGSLPEIARKQGLAQLQVIDSEDSSDLVLCEMITKHFAESFHRCKLVLLVINQRVLWNETCTCCDGMYRSLLDEPEALSLIEDAIDVTGFEIHETLLEQVQLGNFETFAVFDIHEESRHEASESLKFTLSVVAMLAILMLYFSADIMHMSSNNCLHPLWDLMDDMNAMKLIELITASSSFRKLEPVQEAMEEDPETRRCKCKAFAPVPVAQELLGLRRAMSLLESAMIAWSKYVPARWTQTNGTDAVLDGPAVLCLAHGQPATLLGREFANGTKVMIYDINKTREKDTELFSLQWHASTIGIVIPKTFYPTGIKEVCAGMGGITQGLEMAGFTRLASMDINPLMRETLRANGHFNVVQGDVLCPGDRAFFHAAPFPARCFPREAALLCGLDPHMQLRA